MRTMSRFACDGVSCGLVAIVAGCARRSGQLTSLARQTFKAGCARRHAAAHNCRARCFSLLPHYTTHQPPHAFDIPYLTNLLPSLVSLSSFKQIMVGLVWTVRHAHTSANASPSSHAPQRRCLNNFLPHRTRRGFSSAGFPAKTSRCCFIVLGTRDAARTGYRAAQEERRRRHAEPEGGRCG